MHPSASYLFFSMSLTPDDFTQQWVKVKTAQNVGKNLFIYPDLFKLLANETVVKCDI
jgi:hypothetical protein